MTLRTALDAGIQAMGIAVDPQARERLVRYVELIDKWNHTYNLTAVRAPQDMIGQHLLDSLSILTALDPYRNLIDVGSGAGLPGIPLAIVRPQRPVTLLDSNQKKVAFLRQVAIELELGNVTVVSERVEAYRPQTLYAAVVARAFADLADFVRACAHLVVPDGAFLAMKGLYPYEEAARLPEGFVVESIGALAVPGLEARRHLVTVRRK